MTESSWDYLPLIPPKRLKHLYTKKILKMDEEAIERINRKKEEQNRNEEGYKYWHEMMVTRN